MLYEVVLQGTYFGNTIVNRWNYKTTDPTTDHLGAFKLLGALGFFQEGDPLIYPTTKMFYKLFNPLAGTMHFNQVTCKAIYDPLDFYDQAFNPSANGGQTSSEGLSPINAAGFRTSRVRTDIARGTKRLCGVPEEATNAGGTINSTWTGYFNTLADAMSESVSDTTEGITTTFKPAIVGKLKYTTPAGNTAYKYYPTEVAQDAHIAMNFEWSLYTQVRSQTSRQYGKGA